MKYTKATVLSVLSLLGCAASEPPAIEALQTNSFFFEPRQLEDKLSFVRVEKKQQNGARKVLVTLFNRSNKALTLSYRFYWYDANGLEVITDEPVLKTVTIPAQHLFLLTEDMPGSEDKLREPSPPPKGHQLEPALTDQALFNEPLMSEPLFNKESTHLVPQEKSSAEPIWGDDMFFRLLFNEKEK